MADQIVIPIRVTIPALQLAFDDDDDTYFNPGTLPANGWPQSTHAEADHAMPPGMPDATGGFDPAEVQQVAGQIDPKRQRAVQGFANRFW